MRIYATFGEYYFNCLRQQLKCFSAFPSIFPTIIFNNQLLFPQLYSMIVFEHIFYFPLSPNCRFNFVYHPPLLLFPSSYLPLLFLFSSSSLPLLLRLSSVSPPLYLHRYSIVTPSLLHRYSIKTMEYVWSILRGRTKIYLYKKQGLKHEFP